MPIARDFSLDAKYRQEEGVDLPLGHPGAGAAAARPAPRRPPARPQHGHADLRLPRLAARRARPHARAQPAAARASTTSCSSPASTRTSAPPPSTAASSPTTSRSRSTTACSACGTARARAWTAPATSSSTPTSPASGKQRRRAGAGRRRSALEVLDAADPLRGRVLRRAVPGALPGQRAGDPGPRPARLRAVALLRALGRLQDRHQRRRRDRHRRGRARTASRIVDPGFEFDGKPVAAHAEPDAAAALRPARWSARSTTGGWRRPRPSPPPTGSTGSRVATPTPGSASSPPARPTTTCARRSRELGPRRRGAAPLRHPHPARSACCSRWSRASCASSRAGLEEILVVEEKRVVRRAVRPRRPLQPTPSARASSASATSRAARWCRPTASSTPTASPRSWPAASSASCSSTPITARVALLEALRERPGAADAGAPAVLLLGLPAQPLDRACRRARWPPPASAATAWRSSMDRAHDRGSRTWAARARSGSAWRRSRRRRTCSRTSATARSSTPARWRSARRWPPAPTSPTRSSTTRRWR